MGVHALLRQNGVRSLTDRLEITRGRAVDHAEASLRGFCSVLRAAKDSDAPAIGSWKVRDVGAHMRGAFDLYPDMLRGRGSPVASVDGITAFNEQVVSAETRTPRELADDIEQRVPDFVAAAREAGPDPLAWHGGIPLPVESFCALLIGEALVHGYDVAQAEGAQWDLDPGAVRTAFIGLLPVIPYYVDERAAAGVRARFELKLRGEDGARAFLFFDDRRLIVEEPAAGVVDCHISADPVAFMLVSYGRAGPVVPALTGKMLAWGRKPWLGFKIPSLLRSP
jgi:uncharacterized protein (TIGR03083 family)